MLLLKLMEGVTPDTAFEGSTTADDMVLAVNLAEPSATDPGGYFVAQQQISEHSGSLNPQTASNTYIRSGEVETKTGTKRSITVNGDRYIGDAFQDSLLSHKLKYGTGQAVVKEYVYFNMLTGKGEKGEATIVVEDDPGGAAGENASFSATFTARGKPDEYTYAPQTP